jgi:hypothetical protein
VIVGQPLVVDAKEMQDGCVKIVDLHGILDGVITDLIRFAVAEARL